jgi:tetratricopeptide (TPR) repeat protein
MRAVGRYIVAHWHGELSLVQSYWVNGVLVTIVLRGLLHGVSTFMATVPADINFAISLNFLLMLVAVSVWQLVGIWRSAARSLAGTTQRFWPRAAQVAVLVGAAGTGYNMLTTAVDLTSMQAALRDPGLSEYAVERRGDTMVILTGAINDDSAREIMRHFEDPDLKILVVNSAGGLTTPAMTLGRFIAERDIAVVGDGQCISACTLVLAAASRSAIVPGAVVTFHGTEPLTDLTNPDMRRGFDEHVREVDQFLRSFGVKEWAIDKARRQKLWTPTVRQLIDMGLITHIYDLAEQRLVEAKPYCADHPHACPDTVGLASEGAPTLSLGRHHEALMRALEKGDLEAARRHAEAAVADAEKAHGPDSVRFGEALIMLTRVCSLTGDHARAVETGERMVRIGERTFGPNHVETAAGLSILASAYAEQGRLDKAEELFRRSIAIKGKGFGKEHPNTAITEAAFASVLVQQGDLSEAEALLTKALEVFDKAWPVANERMPVGARLNIPATLDSLAQVYWQQDRQQDAEAALKRALAIRKALIGDRHPSVAGNLSSLGVIYGATGRHAEAEQALRQALDIAEASLGPKHPHVAGVAGHLAEACQVQGRHDEAEALFRKCLAIDEAVLAPDHPQLVQHLEAYANLLRAMGRHDEAEPLEARAADFRRN